MQKHPSVLTSLLVCTRKEPTSATAASCLDYQALCIGRRTCAGLNRRAACGAVGRSSRRRSSGSPRGALAQCTRLVKACAKLLPEQPIVQDTDHFGGCLSKLSCRCLSKLSCRCLSKLSCRCLSKLSCRCLSKLSCRCRSKLSCR
jgi:hypothetical protein